MGIPAVAHGANMNARRLKPEFKLFEHANSSAQLNGRRMGGASVSESDFGIAVETDDWKVPAELGVASVASSTQSWNGEKWYPGCYDGDSAPHVFKLGLVVDVAAVEKHGDGLNAMIENAIGRSSFIYESQLNIRIEISG